LDEEHEVPHPTINSGRAFSSIDKVLPDNLGPVLEI